MKIAVLFFCIIVLSASNLFSQQNEYAKLNGPYLGQKPPGMTPEIFAPGIVSTEDAKEFSGSFTPDGKEYYFFRSGKSADLMESKLTNEGWTVPKPAFFNTQYLDNEPHITYDGHYMFFCSSRPYPGSGEGRRMTQVWVMERIDDSWSEPIHLQMGMAPTTAESGNIYIGSNIYRLENDSLRLVGEMIYCDSVALSEKMSREHTCISRDESFCVFDNKEVLYVSFRKKDDKWGKPIDLSNVLNLDGGKILPTLSPDNKYLFFCCSGDIYWIDAKIIEEFRPEE